MPHLNLMLLSAFQATLDNARLTSFHSVKVQALLAYLALEADRPHPRETLATLFWPLYNENSARSSLRQALYELRKLLGDRDDSPASFLLVNRQTVQFNRASDHTVDVADFLAHIQNGRLEEAAALYRGELLSGLACESEPFEEWLRLTRTRFHNLVIDVCFKLTEQALNRVDLAQARSYAERQLTFEPWREEAHRQLMTALALSGDRSAALAQYEACRRMLTAELGVAPDEATTALYEQIKAGHLRGQRADIFPGAPKREEEPPSPHTSPVVRHNLPPPPTTFIGRATDLAQLTERLRDPACRLLTIVGPGGMGKTRLAIQAAQMFLGAEITPSPLSQAQSATPKFADGIFFVALAGIGPADLLVSTLATTLDFTFYGGGEPKTQLLNYLKARSMLLVLDNFEHLLDGADLITDLLRFAPGVKVLVTSREPLNLHEEWLQPLTGMSFPGDAGDASRGASKALTDYTAVQLFVQCARRVKPGFDLGREGAAVARICGLVGGMPLGIELASAWLKHFSCEQIAREVERSLDFLATTLRNIPARHRSIRAVFEHSWNLLTAAERQVLQRISIFRSGFRLEAAQQVAEATFPLLISLAEKSLVQSTPSGRYQIHELLRQFAEEKLQMLLHEWTDVQERHGLYYLRFLQQHATALEGRQMALTVTIVEAEMENIRLAWQWALRHKNVAEISLSLDGLHIFFWVKHWYQEGEALFAQTASMLVIEETTSKQGVLLGRCLAMEANLLSLVYVEIGQFADRKRVESLCQQSLATLYTANASAETGLALMCLARYYRDTGKRAEALIIFGQALDVLSAQGNSLWLRRTLHELDFIHFSLGHYDTALDYLERCIGLCEARGDLMTLGDALNMVGNVYRVQGNYQAARRSSEAALEAGMTADDKRGTAWALQNLGEIAWCIGDYATAQQRSQESLALFTAIGAVRQGHAALNTLGNSAASLGDYAEARRCFRTVLAPWMKTDQLHLMWIEVAALTGLGAVLWKESRPQQAVELLIHTLRQPVGWQATKDRAAALLAELAASLPAEQFAAAQQRAETQDLHTFVAELVAKGS